MARTLQSSQNQRPFGIAWRPTQLRWNWMDVDQSKLRRFEGRREEETHPLAVAVVAVASDHLAEADLIADAVGVAVAIVLGVASIHCVLVVVDGSRDGLLDLGCGATRGLDASDGRGGNHAGSHVRRGLGTVAHRVYQCLYAKNGCEGRRTPSSASC